MFIVLGGIISYPVAFLIDLIHVSLLAKDYADQGYKIKYQEFTNDLNSSNSIWKYLPYTNLIPAINSLSNYLKNRDTRIRRTIFKGEAEPLTEEEQYEYSKKKGIIKAFQISANNIWKEKTTRNLAKKFDVPIEEAFTIKKEFVIDSENIIFYQIDMLNSESGFTVTSARGEMVKELTKEEQLKIINDYYELLDEKINQYIENFYRGNKEKFESDVLNGEVNLNSLKDELKEEYIRDTIIKKLK